MIRIMILVSLILPNTGCHIGLAASTGVLNVCHIQLSLLKYLANLELLI